MHSLSFEVDLLKRGVLAIVPRIDGQSLIDLVTTYEGSRGFDVIGGYGGLIPEFFNYGPLDRYFLEGLPWNKGVATPGLYVLGCQCGEVGCWPLGCAVEQGGETVIWRDFNQEHRPGRDYSGFGPFTFDRADYLRMIAALPKV